MSNPIEAFLTMFAEAEITPIVVDVNNPEEGFEQVTEAVRKAAEEICSDRNNRGNQNFESQDPRD